MARANRVSSGARPIALRETPRAAGHGVGATEAPAAHGDCGRHCSFNEFQEHLDDALAELPEKLRLVLLLAAMEGHTIEEIASMLGISTGTVKSRIFYARKQLAEKF